MSELTLLILRLGFLLVLWGFVFAVVYALRTDLFGERVRRQPAAAGDAADAASASFPPAPQQFGGMTAGAAPQTMQVPRPDAPVARASAPQPEGPAGRLVITSGGKAGLELTLDTQPLTIGRSSESGLVIRDDYTSTHHARLMVRNGAWVIQDLDSTNGPFLNGVRVNLPTPVPLDTPVRIGTTTFELRR